MSKFDTYFDIYRDFDINETVKNLYMSRCQRPLIYIHLTCILTLIFGALTEELFDMYPDMHLTCIEYAN